MWARLPSASGQLNVVRSLATRNRDNSAQSWQEQRVGGAMDQSSFAPVGPARRFSSSEVQCASRAAKSGAPGSRASYVWRAVSSRFTSAKTGYSGDDKK